METTGIGDANRSIARRWARWGLGLGLAAALVGCSTTRIVSTWKEPSANAVEFRKVLVVSPSRDESLRRIAEDELVHEMTGTVAVPSYTILSQDQIQDQNLLKQLVRERGFDGLVVFRVAAVDQQFSWVPGAYAGPTYAYGGWPMYDPGYIHVDTVARVETNVYSVPDQKLIWASASNTFNPSSATSLVDDVARAVGKEMRKEGFLPAGSGR